MNTEKQRLFRRDFTLVVIGQIISLFGNGVLRFALPLYLLRETGSSGLFGMVSACSFIPMIFFSLAGGVLADRVNKRNIMAGLDFATAGLVLVFYLLHGKLPLVPLMIVCLMILYGISGAYEPAVQASIPLLVQREQIMQGNAVINMVNTLAGLLGPVIGGGLFGIGGIDPILFISIGCFFSSAVMELFIRIPYQRKKTSEGIFTVIRADLLESWNYIRKERTELISVVIVLALFNLVLSSALVVGIPVMVVQVLGMSDAQLGITQGAMGLGGLFGGLLGGVLGERFTFRKCHWILFLCSGTAALMGAALLDGVPAAWGFRIITVLCFLAMASSTVFTVQICTVIQQQTPPHLVGKIMAFILAAANCAAPLGQAVYGVLFDVCSRKAWIVMFGAAGLALAISMYSRRAFERFERS
ncbi:MAG: MFS transporter [Lachnospiraceae bacterium]|nr:MFS transporter [Lachnospiraceae bacterium]